MGRPKKYKTEEERKAARAEQSRLRYGPRKTADRKSMTEEELSEHLAAQRLRNNAKVRQSYIRRRVEVGKTYIPQAERNANAMTLEESRVAAVAAVGRWQKRNPEYTRVAAKRHYLKMRQDPEWVAAYNAKKAQWARERYQYDPRSPKMNEEERRAKAAARWKTYYENETPEQRAERLAAKAHYRLTEVQPKVREIVEHILYDFGKASDEDELQGVADEWHDTGASCWLTAKALWYRDVAVLMEHYGYEDQLG